MRYSKLIFRPQFVLLLKKISYIVGFPKSHKIKRNWKAYAYQNGIWLNMSFSINFPLYVRMYFFVSFLKRFLNSLSFPILRFKNQIFVSLLISYIYQTLMDFKNEINESSYFYFYERYLSNHIFLVIRSKIITA